MKGCDMDLTHGRMKLANYYVKTKRFENALSLLSGLITRPEDSPVRDPAGSFASSLWQKWNHGDFAFDVMVSALEKPCLLLTIQKNLMLFPSQVLGLLRRPVSVLDPTFFAQYLYVESYAGMVYDDWTAIQPILDEMEVTAQREESLLHDKRTVGYCNLLAHLYFLLGDQGIAINLLKRSARMMRGPSNPATLALLGLQMERIKKFCVRGATVAAVAMLSVFLFRLRYHT